MAHKDKRVIFKHINPVSQQEVKTCAGMREIQGLDRALWTCTGASVDAINCDPVFLEHLDSDKNSRIMCFEVTEAITWLLRNLRERRGIETASTVLALDAINTEHAEGKAIALSASQALQRLARPEARVLALEEVRGIKEEIEKIPLSGAEVVLPEAAESPDLKLYFQDIIRTVGGEKHPSGKPGVTRGCLDRFLAACKAYLAWFDRGRLENEQAVSPVKPLGESTETAFNSYKNIREKMDAYFMRCHLEAFRQNVGARKGQNPEKAETAGSALPAARLENPEEIRLFLKNAFLAEPVPERVFYFKRYINFYYEEDIRCFQRDVARPFWKEEKEEISEKEWQELRRLFAPFEKWQQDKKGAEVAAVGIETLHRYCDSDFYSRAVTLIEVSLENSLLLDEIKVLEKLILYQALLIKFLNNFVYFPYLYDPRRRALFEMGTLIMDGRKFKLSLKVYDHAQHRELAANSNMFILYVSVLAPAGPQYEIAVPVTSGGQGNLYTGKRGIFTDIHNKDFDAVVTDIIENPISLGEAFLNPFIKLGRLINAKIEELKHMAESRLDTVVKDTHPAEAVSVPTPAGKSGMGNIFMSGGIAVAALGSAMALITRTISEVKWSTLLATILGALFAVLFPTFISAFNKLRKRDLSTILEASGWAVNVRMNLTFKLGRFFTEKPVKGKIIPRLRRVFRVLILLLCLSLVVLGILFRNRLSGFISLFSSGG